MKETGPRFTSWPPAPPEPPVLFAPVPPSPFPPLPPMPDGFVELVVVLEPSEQPLDRTASGTLIMKANESRRDQRERIMELLLKVGKKRKAGTETQQDRELGSC